jgi:hypothetical protein
VSKVRPAEKEVSTLISKKELVVRRWQWVVVLFLVSGGLLVGGTGAAERTRPFHIGALTNSWGPTPQIVGLRDGLVALSYREAEARAVLRRVTRGEVDAILAPSGVSLNIPGFVLEAGQQGHLSTLFDSVFYGDRGGLASYGPDYYETSRQAARLVDKILKGANPAEIPVEVNPKIEFVINLKTAKALGLSIAPEVLFQADRVVR